jgi:hypothetical protein
MELCEFRSKLRPFLKRISDFSSNNLNKWNGQEL